MAEVTQSEFDLARIRQSAEDLSRIMDALAADGTLTIVEDAPVEPEVDEEGNELPPEPVAASAVIAITVENAAVEEEEEEEE